MTAAGEPREAMQPRRRRGLNVPGRSPDLLHGANTPYAGISEGISTWAIAIWDWLAGPRYLDNRVAGWPLLGWKPAVSVTLLYLAGVWLGKRYMANREAINVRPFAIVHNLAMTLLSAYMFTETLTQAYIVHQWDKKFVLWGNPHEWPNFSIAGRRMAVVLWIHVVSKVYEFVDTFIMVARKNNRQITFLHLYHHASTYLFWCLTMCYGPSGDAYFLCAVNSAVHVVMYSYYFVTSAGKLKVPQGIKRAITVLQLAQFASILVGAFYIIGWTDTRPRFGVPMVFLQTIVFFTLFLNFYRKAYLKTRQQAGAARAKAAAQKKAQGNSNVCTEKVANHKTL